MLSEESSRGQGHPPRGPAHSALKVLCLAESFSPPVVEVEHQRTEGPCLLHRQPQTACVCLPTASAGFLSPCASGPLASHPPSEIASTRTGARLSVCQGPLAREKALMGNLW